MAELPPRGKCPKCRYDLRGIQSKLCPECGEPLSAIAIMISDAQQYHLARAAFEHEQILAAFRNPTGGIAFEVPQAPGLMTGCLWVMERDLDRADEILDDLGIPSSLGSLPIVDRSEPLCPNCNADLPLDGTEQCPNCGGGFQWVDVGEELADESP